jgi:ABC-type nitrate/sulfonate/bicarbonate transport system ATPase subunit
MVKVEDLSQRFGALPVLDRLSFSLSEGELVSIVGPSGCGKTVLLRILAGLDRPSSGRIFLGAPQVAYAFQKSPLFPWLSLSENVRICTPPGREKLIASYFELAGLSGFRHELPSRISVGMRQKVNVIRAFCSGHPIILMDEPFVSLDFPGRRELQQLTLELWKREGKTILFVTHDIDEALLMSQRLLVFSGRPGRIVKELPVWLAYPRDPQTARGKPEYLAAFREVAEILLDRQGRRG